MAGQFRVLLNTRQPERSVERRG